MAIERVVQLTAEHIPSLVTRLRSYGIYSLQTRSILRLLQTRVNTAPFQIFAAGADGADLMTLTVMRPTPGHSVLDVCGREDSAGRRQLASLLRSPDLAGLWQRPLRVEFIAEGLASVFSAAAEDNAMGRILVDYETLRLFVRPGGLPCPPRQERPGLSVRPLQPHHLAKVERFWWNPRDLYPDSGAILRNAQAAGLSAGVFLAGSSEAEETGSPLDEPVSWTLVTGYGAHGFAYTEEAYRGRGLQTMVVAELLYHCAQRDLSCFGYTTDTNISAVRSLEKFGCAPTKRIAMRLCFVPK